MHNASNGSIKATDPVVKVNRKNAIDFHIDIKNSLWNCLISFSRPNGKKIDNKLNSFSLAQPAQRRHKSILLRVFTNLVCGAVTLLFFI